MGRRVYPPLAERFWAKVEKSPEPNGCWLWTGGKYPDGYGCIRLSGKPKRAERAHRVGYVLQIGPIPDGLCVLHHCDTRPCVRGDHLFAGTKGDNNRDAYSKGRHTTQRQRVIDALHAGAR